MSLRYRTQIMAVRVRYFSFMKRRFLDTEGVKRTTYVYGTTAICLLNTDVISQSIVKSPHLSLIIFPAYYIITSILIYVLTR